MVVDGQFKSIIQIEGDLKEIKEAFGSKGSEGTLLENVVKIRKMDEGSRSIALDIAKKVALMDYNKLLTENPVTGEVKAEDPDKLSFNGKDLEGGNFSNVDGLVGGRGTPIGLDAQPPMTVTPLSPSRAKRLAAGGQDFLKSMTPQQKQDSLLRSLPMLAGSIASVAGGQEASKWAGLAQQVGFVGQGLFQRDYQPGTDDYLAAAGKLGPSVMAQVMSEKGGSFHPAVGAVTSALSVAPALDNLFSNGGFQAVEQFSQSAGRSASNLFSGSARAYARDSLSLLQQTGRIGYPMTVADGKGGKPSGSPSALPQASPLKFGFSPFAPLFLLAQASPSPAAASRPQVVVQTLGDEGMSSYKGMIERSNQQIRENWQRHQRLETLNTYTKKEIKALQELVKQTEEIRSKMTKEDAIPQATQILQSFLSQIADAQRFYTRNEEEIHRLYETRVRLLQERESSRSAVETQMRDNAPAALEAALSSKSI